MTCRVTASLAGLALVSALAAGCGGARVTTAAEERDAPRPEPVRAPDVEAAEAPACEWRATTIAPGPVMGQSLALDARDVPHVVYTRSVQGTLVYAELRGGEWVSTELTEDGSRASLVAEEGELWVSYREFETRSLLVAHRQGEEWSHEVVESPTDGVSAFGLETSIAAHEGTPSVAYYARLGGGVEELRYARPSGGAWQVETVDGAVEDAMHNPPPLLLLGPDGAPSIVHVGTRAEEPPRLRPLLHALRGDAGWSASVIHDVSSTEVGFEPAAAVDGAGQLHVTAHAHGSFSRERGFDSVVHAARPLDGEWAIERWEWPSHLSRVRLSFDRADRAHALSVGVGGELDRVVHSVRRASGEWSRSVIAEGDVHGLRLAIASSGEVHALYIQNRALVHARSLGCVPSP